MNPSAPVPHRLRWLAALALAASGSSLRAQAPAAPDDWKEKAWQEASALLVDEAIADLPAARKARDAAERREIDYSRAVLLLNAQPKTQGHINQARDLLESVRQTRLDDDLGLDATYYLARIAQFHSEPPDPDKAAALYQELIERAPLHPLAQEAASRLAVLRLIVELSPQERVTRMTQFEALATRLQSPPALRDLHFVLAEALLRFGGDKEAMLRHLLAAEQAGIVRQQLASDTLVRIALLARDLGHRDIAVAHYEKFLAEFQRDSRAYMLNEQLKSLQAQATPAPATEAVPAVSPPTASPEPAASAEPFAAPVDPSPAVTPAPSA